ncbi:MAG: hypothetical protein K1X85_02135 [Ignavibacteria bacterium]|nr:hypothetical protein [Ignavibacteria bacterium]
MRSPDLKFSRKLKPELKSKIEKNYRKLLLARKADQQKADSVIERELLELNRVSKSAIGKNELKLYARLYTKHKLACESERLRLLGKKSDTSGILIRHRAAFKKDVEKSIPGISKLVQKRRQLFSRLSKAGVVRPPRKSGIVKGISSNLLEILEGFEFNDPTAVSIEPPYHFTENRIDIIHNNFNSLNYDSLADADSGLIIHNITSYHEDNAWFTHKAAKYEAHAGFGVNYTMPVTGTVSVDVLLQSLYNKNLISITDNSGLSEGYANLENKLYMNILHPNNIVPFEIELNKIDMSTGGDDKTVTHINKIDTEFAKWINFRSTGSFIAGTELQILIGNKESLYNILDDMQCSSETLYSWFVRKIVVKAV